MPSKPPRAAPTTGKKSTGSGTSRTTKAGKSRKTSTKSSSTGPKKQVVSKSETLAKKFCGFLPQIAKNLFVPLCNTALQDPYVNDVDTLLETLETAGVKTLSVDDLNDLLESAGLYLRARLELVTIATDEVFGHHPVATAPHPLDPTTRHFFSEEPPAEDTSPQLLGRAFPDEVEPEIPEKQTPRFDLAAMIPDPGPPIGGMGAKFSTSIGAAINNPSLSYGS